MFPSSSCGNPFPFPGQSFMNDENPNSGSSPLFFHFPPPLLDDNDEFLMTHFFSPEPFLTGSTKAVSTIMENNQVTNNAAAEPTVPTKTLQKKRRNGGKKLVPRKRTGKKDRHSKIFTAKGLRHRRLRLSVQIAQKFFDLQDILGFDKASKTIDWLLTKSKAAIKELTGNLSRVKQNRHEVVLGKKKIADNGNQIEDFVGNMPMEKSGPLAMKRSRDKARERARERTREKMMIRNLEKHRTCSDQENPTNLELSQSSNSGSHDTNSSLKVVAEVEEPITQLLEHQMDSVTIVENFLGGSTSRAPDFPASWEIDNAGSQYSDCALTNMNLSAGNTKEQNPNLISIGTSNSQDCYPNSIFMASPNYPEQNPISIFLNTQEQNPSLLFMSPSNIQEQNPSSIFMSPSSIHIWSQFF